MAPLCFRTPTTTTATAAAAATRSPAAPPHHRSPGRPFSLPLLPASMVLPKYVKVVQSQRSTAEITIARNHNSAEASRNRSRRLCDGSRATGPVACHPHGLVRARPEVHTRHLGRPGGPPEPRYREFRNSGVSFVEPPRRRLVPARRPARGDRARNSPVGSFAASTGQLRTLLVPENLLKLRLSPSRARLHGGRGSRGGASVPRGFRAKIAADAGGVGAGQARARRLGLRWGRGSGGRAAGRQARSTQPAAALKGLGPPDDEPKGRVGRLGGDFGGPQRTNSSAE